MPALHSPPPSTPKLAGHRSEHLDEGHKHIFTNFACDGSVQMYDLVFIGSTGILESSDSTNATHVRATIGMVIEKPSAAEARVKYNGLIFDYDETLVKGSTYFMDPSNPGRITNIVPTGNVVLSKVGVALDEETFFLDISRTLVIRTP